MKKHTALLILALMACGFALHAQTNKGNIFLAGNSNLLLNAGGEKEKYNDDVEGKYSSLAFDFQPFIGYFFIDNLVPGIFIDISTTSYKDKDSDGKWTESEFALGPFVRYYIYPLKQIKPFAHGQIGFGGYREKWGSDPDPYKERYFTYLLGLGVDYFFNKNVGCEFLLGFNHDAWTEKVTEDSRAVSEDTYKWINNSMTFRIGIVVILGDN